VGVGSGLNLSFYSTAATRVRGIDPSEELVRIAQARAASASVPVELLTGSAVNIPAESHTVDTVVMTWTLCSMSDPNKALAEMLRALKHTKIMIDPQWKSATIPRRDGGIMTPTRSSPTIPRGLPTRSAGQGRDVIDTRDGQNRADQYRYKRDVDANASKRNVPVRVMIQENPYGIHCPPK
jgi:SAM-dependent methyltransferase